MDDKKRFVYNDWMTTSDQFEGKETEFSLVINYPDANTFPSLMELRNAVEELWTRNKRDFYCPTSPWETKNIEPHDFNPPPMVHISQNS